MRAVLRVWWTFFTAVPLQRWLAVVGVALGGLAFVAVSVSRQGPESAFVYSIAAAAFSVWAVVPAVFAGGALLRMLSSPRSHQLLPYFRVRMLAAVALLVASLVLWFAAFMAGPVLAAGHEPWGRLLILPFAFVTGTFLWIFLVSGDVRWGLMGLLLVVFTSGLMPTVAASGSVQVAPLAAGLAVLAWLAFAVWYLRVRRVPPLQLVAAPWRWQSGTDRLRGPNDAMCALVAGYFEWPLPQRVLGAAAVGVALCAFLASVSVWSGRPDRLLHLTMFIWPFGAMAIMCIKGAQMAYRSRALWLQIPGRRDDLRAQIERLVGRAWLLVVVTMLTVVLATRLFGTSWEELSLALALCASAGLYGGWLSLAAVTGVKTYLAGIGLMTLAHLGLLARPEPSFTAVTIVIVAQLFGAALFRALAVRRWRRIDWLSFRPPAIVTRGVGWTN